MRILLIISITIMLQGCTLLDFIKPNPGIAVDTELVVGDKKEEIASGAVVGKKETTHNTADSIQQSYTTVTPPRDNTLLIIVAIIGWMAPDPARIMAWLTALIRRLYPST